MMTPTNLSSPVSNSCDKPLRTEIDPMNPNLTRLLSRKELSELWGVTPRHIVNLEKIGLRTIRLGGAVRYDPDEVKSFLDQNRHLKTSVHRRGERQKKVTRK